MMKYLLTAQALRIFSTNKSTKKIYRSIGNVKNAIAGSKETIKRKYVVTAKQLTEVIDAYDIARPGMNVMEIGTGWVHWDSIVLRNKIDCNVLLYDVWDNRSFNKFINYCSQLADPEIRARVGFEGAINSDLMARLIKCESLDAAYELLGFKYLIDPSGTLNNVADGRFDLVVSNAVFEHLRAEDTGTIIQRIHDVLRPGGWAIHLVSLQDHLKIYAKSAHIKEYLRFSKDEYNKKYQNDVQYINLMQIPEWLALFEATGFEVLETKRLSGSDLSHLPVHDSWRGMSEEDLACSVVQFVTRRPPDAAGPDAAALRE
ncbi:methyltransferase domain-containing protein [uncultured Amaricoccus sp.]|uniref:class I SAM-dependent methyltransferase n=1 Tax=uncultured Amaricoccus sp. TaxID=339341 RepID=UPI003459BEE5